MGNLCTLPLSSMESVFHFILGTTGSSVCFRLGFALVDLLLCTSTLGVVPFEFVGGALIAVSGVGILFVHIFFKVVECMVKACGHLIFGNLTFPIAFACVLPSMIGPVVLVTSNTVGNALLLICRCKTHDPRLCTDCPPYASICTLGGLGVFSHS